MDMVMAGLDVDMCLVYLEADIVFSATMEEHFIQLRSVLSRLRGAGLKLKPSKCRLLQRLVCFLRHVVSEGRVSTDPEKVTAITEWPVLTNLLSKVKIILIEGRLLPQERTNPFGKEHSWLMLSGRILTFGLSC